MAFYITAFITPFQISSILKLITFWHLQTKLFALSTAMLAIHVLEEWRFPGGFHYMYNISQNTSLFGFLPISIGFIYSFISEQVPTILDIILAVVCGAVLMAISLSDIEYILKSKKHPILMIREMAISKRHCINFSYFPSRNKENEVEAFLEEAKNYKV